MKQIISLILFMSVCGAAHAAPSFENCSADTKSVVKKAVDFSSRNFNKIINSNWSIKADFGLNKVSRIKTALNNIKISCEDQKSSRKCKKGILSYGKPFSSTIVMCEDNIQVEDYNETCAMTGLVLFEAGHIAGIKRSSKGESLDPHKRRYDKAWVLEYAGQITCYKSKGLM